MANFYDFKMKTIDGAERSLADFKGKVVLVVNVASQCGLTPQYEGLQKLHQDLSARGFSVLGFPCNQFAGQEPGSEAQVKSFCETQYGVTFPLSAKVEVNGGGRSPLYGWLTSQPTAPEGPGDIKWNFGKFLIDKKGEVAARFDPTITPGSPELKQAIEKALG
jgi:glutathione peroxidase